MTEMGKMAVGVGLGVVAVPYLAGQLNIQDSPGPGMYEVVATVTILAALYLVKGF